MTRAYLLTIEPCQSGQIVSSSQERCRIGAGPACTLRLEGAAPEHAEVWLDEDAVKLRKLGSSAATYINDVRVVGDVVVAAEDVVRLGPAQVPLARRSREDVVRSTWEGTYGDLGERSVLRQDQTLSSRVTPRRPRPARHDDLGQRATLQLEPALSGQPTLGGQATDGEGDLGVPVIPGGDGLLIVGCDSSPRFVDVATGVSGPKLGSVEAQVADLSVDACGRRLVVLARGRAPRVQELVEARRVQTAPASEHFYKAEARMSAARNRIVKCAEEAGRLEGRVP